MRSSLLGLPEDFQMVHYSLSVYVARKVAPLSNLLASAQGDGIIIAVDPVNLGVTRYMGPGAGHLFSSRELCSSIRYCPRCKWIYWPRAISPIVLDWL